MISSRIIEIAGGDGQVASGSASLPDSVALETEEQTLERDDLSHTSSLLGGRWVR